MFAAWTVSLSPLTFLRGSEGRHEGRPDAGEHCEVGGDHDDEEHEGGELTDKPEVIRAMFVQRFLYLLHLPD